MNGVKLEELGVTYTNGPSSSLLSVSNPFSKWLYSALCTVRGAGSMTIKKTIF